MTLTRPVPNRTTDQRPRQAPSMESASRDGSSALRTLALVILGAVVLTASIVGVFHLANLGVRGNPEPSPAAAASDVEIAVGFGHADVEGGVISLHPLVQGRVVEVNVKEGDSVKKGAILLKIDDRQARAQVKEAEGAVAMARGLLDKALAARDIHKKGVEALEAAVKIAELDVTRAEIVFKEEERLKQQSQGSPLKYSVAKADFEKAQEAVQAKKKEVEALKARKQEIEAEIHQAQGVLEAREAALERARLAVEEHSLKAPVDGTILRLSVSVGDLMTAQPRQPAIQFCPNTPRIIRAEVEQEYASRVKVGQVVQVQDDARWNAQQWKGKVRSISDWYTQRRSQLHEPRQFNDVRTLECIIELEPGHDLKIGQRVRVRFLK